MFFRVMKKGIVIGVTAVVLIAIVAFYFSGKDYTSGYNTTIGSGSQAELIVFDIPKKSAHYESNTPSHGSVVAGVPINVVIDFNFDLATPSSILILNAKTGEDFGIGSIEIDSNKLAMRKEMKEDSPNGLYNITYKACWPDESCHDGKFQFAIDKTKANEFIDMTGKSEVTINAEQISLKPMKVKISKGTQITWINQDSVQHFVNTDAHPSHTYFSEQNSRALGEEDSFSIVFDKSGFYPYHCSAHASVMKGEILVE